MSKEYDLYLVEHKRNVCNGFSWIRINLPEIISDEITETYNHMGVDLEQQIIFSHDASKTDKDEYDAYDAYFYGGNRSYEVVQQFNFAWLMHIHKNPHHWQHWVLITDNPEDGGEVILEMPYNYIIEMICDWWSFSWKTGNLYEIFNWYNEHKDWIKLHDSTRKIVEKILGAIHAKLDEKKKEWEE